MQGVQRTLLWCPVAGAKHRYALHGGKKWYSLGAYVRCAWVLMVRQYHSSPVWSQVQCLCEGPVYKRIAVQA